VSTLHITTTRAVLYRYEGANFAVVGCAKFAFKQMLSQIRGIGARFTLPTLLCHIRG
jgi:hypothetical protein